MHLPKSNLVILYCNFKNNNSTKMFTGYLFNIKIRSYKLDVIL